MNWTELYSPSPSMKPLYIVGVEAKNNFWISDKKEFVYQWDGKKWNKFILPKYETILTAECFYSKKDEILFAITNKNYQTSFFQFVNKQWKKLLFSIDSRTQNITATKDSMLYIFGDWGSLVRIKNNEWEKFETPFKNHLVAFIEIDRGQYLISVRSEGVFRFNGSTFSAVSIPERYRVNIVRLIKTKSKIFALSAHQHVLEFNGNNFVESPVSAQEIVDQYSEKHFGFSRIMFSRNERQNLFSEVPRNVRILNHALIDSNTAVITTETGKIFIGEKTNTGYFVNVTNAYNVAMNPEYPILTAQPSDINGDDLIDIVVINKQKKNSATVFFNNVNAPFSQDSKLLESINTENLIACITSDINGDSSPDIIIARTDSSGTIIEMYEQDNGKGFYLTVTVKTEQLNYAQRLTSMNSFDYDFDGDNDLVLTFYHDEQMQKGFVLVLKNSWWGRSFDVDTSLISQTRGWNTGISITDLNGDSTPEIIVINRWGQNTILEYGPEGWRSVASQQYRSIQQLSIQHIIFADVDLDGDNDGIILSDSAGIQLLRNTGASEMKIDDRDIFPAELTKKNNHWQTIVSADINFDGFSDIVLSTLKRNYVLINNFGFNFLDMTTEYKLSDPILKRMIVKDIDNDGDVDIFGYNDERSALFENTTDPLGMITVRIADKIAGKKNGIVSFVSSVPGIIFRFFVKTEVQLYLAVIILSFLAIWSGLRIGKTQFQWETNVQLWFVSSNMFLFWILSMFTYSQEFTLKYVLPLVIVAMGTGIPLVLYGIVRKKILSQESEKALHYQLLETVIEFMHGQWAIKNLNGLMLYCSDMAEMVNHEPSMLEQLQQRKAMFFDMTMPRLQMMCSLAVKTGIHRAIARDIQDRLDEIHSILQSNSWMERTQLSSANIVLKSLKSMINDYREKVLKEYSCNPNTIMEQVVSILKNEDDRIHNISIHTELSKESGKVLIKSFELADIIENGIRNALQAVSNQRQSCISLLVYRVAPKICIDIVDTGIGIPKEKWEKIFQKGYSENHSTGLGLSIARDILEKYGGRIFVKQSEENVGTTFTIELNEVP